MVFDIILLFILQPLPLMTVNHLPLLTKQQWQKGTIYMILTRGYWKKLRKLLEEKMWSQRNRSQFGILQDRMSTTPRTKRSSQNGSSTCWYSDLTRTSMIKSVYTGERRR
ncbi:uncharacterized protein LOC106164607 [Lingula anatina]|uniref:Uncharacterized protein LOC106164607 n=1 Tax=Lingula anatina TaxID=7574 RepID=A0A1S3IIG0_LINAN|nr:uncharacterized protein LOC106164607 [Lingula anatina]|eukprot:XP_013398025.1 uncharacterized protein LOC106164607 [Lingula anatina]